MCRARAHDVGGDSFAAVFLLLAVQLPRSSAASSSPSVVTSRHPKVHNTIPAIRLVFRSSCRKFVNDQFSCMMICFNVYLANYLVN